MKKNILISVITLLLLVSVIQAEERSYEDYKISGPYTYNNLSLFLVKSQQSNNNIDFTTLSEAINANKITVVETGNVEELSLDNKCGTPIFIQGGDIVKGGQQDRLVRYDLVVYPIDKKLALKSFCVESNRWSQRDNESVGHFSSSEKQIASKELKLASKLIESQQEVWQEVDKVQTKLSKNLGVHVRGSRSPSSLQLALENETVMEQTTKYVDYFTEVIENESNVVGFIFGISNYINSGDIYHSPELFKKMYPKMIESASIEALSGIDLKYKNTAITVDDVYEWLKEVDTGNESKKIINDNTYIKINESMISISFDTFDKRFGDTWIHKNIIKK